MILINQENLPLVAMEFMNNTHKEDVEIINELFAEILRYAQTPTQENEEKINGLYSKWFEHTVEHFRAEEVMMREKNFPPYPMHKGEHDNALRIMDEVFRQWQATKDIDFMKSYLSEHLVQWLMNHISTMDTVTARFFESGISPCSLH